MNLLSALPEWFTSWGWILIVAAVVVIVIVVILIVVAKKRGASDGAEETEVKDSPAEETPAADEPEVEEYDKPEAEDEEVEEESEEEQPAAQESSQSSEEAVRAEVKADKLKPNKTYHIAKRKVDNRWQVKMAGGSKAIKLFNTQYEAIDFAKKLAENQEAKIVIHKEDGTFRRLTYHKKK